MDARAEAARGFETEAQFSATVADLHARVFRNYIHWGEYTGMLDRAKATGSLDDSWLDAGAAGARRDRAKEFTLATFMTADADGLWEKGSREHKSAVTHNARLHQLCLWFLLYGESANLRHAPEAMCFIFHAAMCAVTLEDRAPAPCPMTDKEPVGDQLVLAKPVAGCKMPHAKDDYLNSIVRPLFCAALGHSLDWKVPSSSPSLGSWSLRGLPSPYLTESTRFPSSSRSSTVSLSWARFRRQSPATRPVSNPGCAPRK